MASNTSRTIKALKEQGMKPWIVEKFNRFGGEFGIRQDLYGIIDVIALNYETGVVGVQCCSGSGYTSHMTKILEEHRQDTIDWLKTPGCSLELWAWRKLKVKRGGKAYRWVPRIQEITMTQILERDKQIEGD